MHELTGRRDRRSTPIAVVPSQGRGTIRSRSHGHSKPLLDAYSRRGRDTEATLSSTRQEAACENAPALSSKAVSLDSAADVIDAFRRLYGSAVAAVDAAELLGDTRLTLAALRDTNDLLQQVAKAFGLFGDDKPTLVIDQSRRLTTIVAQLSDAQLLALANGSISPAVLGIDETLVVEAA